MLRSSIIALSAAAVLGATALAPAEALAHGGGGGSHSATAYRPIAVNSGVSAQLGLGGGNKFVPRPHPPFTCKFCVFPPHGPPPHGPPPVQPSPGHGFTASFGGGDFGGSSVDSCDVVRKRTPSGRIIEVCDDWLAQ